MAIRPIDMQTLIPKMEKMDAARNKTINKTDNDLQQNQMQSKMDSQLKPNQVGVLEQKSHNALKNDEKDKDSGKQSSQNPNQHQTEEDEQNDTRQKKSKKIVRGHFDMKV